MLAVLLRFTIMTSTTTLSAAPAPPPPACGDTVGITDVDAQGVRFAPGGWWYVRYPSYWDPSRYVDYPGSPFSSYDSANEAFYRCNQEHDNACLMWGPV